MTLPQAARIERVVDEEHAVVGERAASKVERSELHQVAVAGRAARGAELPWKRIFVASHYSRKR